MSLTTQAKTLTKPQIKLITGLINQTRYPVRNLAIFLLSVRAGLTWEMVASRLEKPNRLSRSSVRSMLG